MFLDIETSLNIVGTFSLKIHSKYLNPDCIIKERAIICICWKWAGEKKVHSLSWDKNQCDKSMLKKFSKEIMKADLVVAQNGDKFDVKFCAGRLCFHRLPPWGDLLTEDTLKISRKAFYLNSHKLDYMAKFFKLDKGKHHTSLQLWIDICVNKCFKALKKMISYCKHDVVLLEKTYRRIIKYAPKAHKGRMLGNGIDSCRACGSKDLMRNGFKYLASGIVQQRYVCRKCCAHTHVKIKK